MLHLLEVVFIALLCTATATVRGDGYSDGTAVEQSVKEVSTCNNEDCDAECRSIGCARGLCAGDDCYCDIWRSINEIKQSRNISGIKRTIKDLNKCNELECYQECIKFGYISGTCVGNTCTCKIRLSEGTAVEQSVKEVSTCNNEDCDAECRSIGCARGLCAGDDCYCDIWRSNNVITPIHNISGIKRTIKDLNKCNELECYQECIKFGYISGTCVGNTCTCKIRLSEEMTIAKDVKNLKYCWDNQCDLDCSERGYISGRCIDNHCTCKLFKGTTVQININEVSTCDSPDCDQKCRKTGSTSGNCVGDSCMCTEAISKIDDNKMMSNEITGCTQYTCRSVCKDLGHTGGKCFHGKCKCNIKLGPLFQVLINDDSEKKDDAN